MGISISETPHSTLAVNFIFSSMNFNAFGRLVGGGDISISERLSYRNHYMCSGEATSIKDSKLHDMCSTSNLLI